MSFTEINQIESKECDSDDVQDSDVDVGPEVVEIGKSEDLKVSKVDELEADDPSPGYSEDEFEEDDSSEVKQEEQVVEDPAARRRALDAMDEVFEVRTLCL